MPRVLRAVFSAAVFGSAAWCSVAVAQQELPVVVTRAADEPPPIPEVRELLATVYGTPIYADEMEPFPIAKEKRVEEPGSEGFNRWLETTRRNNLQHRVVQLLQVKVIEEAGLAPTEEEIAAVIEFRNALEDQRLEDLITMRDGLETEVTRQRADGHEPPDEILLDLRRLREEVALAEKHKTVRKPTDRDAIRRMQMAHRRFAEQAVMSWKFTRLIYEKYDGKVLIVGSNIQPIEAYLQLFDEEQGAGNLKFETEAAKEAVVGAFAALGPQLVEPEANPFAVPWWEMPVPRNITLPTAPVAPAPAE